MARVCPDCGRHYGNEVLVCPVEGARTFVVHREQDLVGTTIDGRFTLRELLGLGGMGAVYRAHQHSMDRDVALKLLRPEMATDENAVRRFLREARAASRLNSPHTITVFDFGQSPDGVLYIAMELLHGRSLSRELRTLGRPMEVGRAVRIIDQVLDSLDEAHAQGILHRDLKPDNIFLLETRSGEDFVKVLDFGIAKMRESDGKTLTQAGMAFGTPTYMSPEQAQARELDAQSDLYSVGVILFEMLAGKPPFEAETPLAMALRKIQEKAPTVFHVNPEVRIPEGLERLLASLLDASASNRPASAAEFRQLLVRALQDSETTAMTSVVVRHGVTSRLEALPGASPASSKPPDSAPDPTPAPVLPARRGNRAWRSPWVAGGVLAVALLAAGLLRTGPTDLAGGDETPSSASQAVVSTPPDAGAPTAGTKTPGEPETTGSPAPAEAPTVAVEVPTGGPTPPPPEASPTVSPPSVPAAGSPDSPRARVTREAAAGRKTPTVRPDRARDPEVERLLKPGRTRPVEDSIPLKGTR